MNGRTNAKNGAGAIRDGCAVLEIRAPSGSQIIATRSDGLIKKQDKGYIDFSDNYFWLYYIIIQKFEIDGNQWNITCTHNSNEDSTLVDITTGQFLSIELFSIYGIKNGNITDVLRYYDHSTGAKQNDYYVLTPTGNYYCMAVFGPVNCTGRIKLILDVGPNCRSYHGGIIPSIGISTSETQPTLNQTYGSITPRVDYSMLTTDSASTVSIEEGRHEMNINVNGQHYIWFSWSAQSSNYHPIYVKNFFII